MRVLHDSRDNEYRAPYGTVALGASVTLALDVFDDPGATVTLRTWIEGRGEGLYPMEAVSTTRHQVVVTPEAAGVVWYHFIITGSDGTQRRYGAVEGARGGEGKLYDWEPPSFQLTVFDEANRLPLAAVEQQALGRLFEEVFVGFLRDEVSAPAFAEAFEALRENCPADEFAQAFDLLGGGERVKLLVQLAGLDPAEASAGEDDDNDDDVPTIGDVIEGGQLGLAKGRLWCASLVQLLAVGLPANEGGVAVEAEPYDHAVERWSAVDGDCEAIVCNAVDLRFALPAFEHQVSTPFAVNDDVVGFWCHDDDGTSACVLVNSSLRDAFDVSVPMVSECVSEVIAGYGVPVVDAEEAGQVAPVFADAERYARVHLYQLGTAILYFHGAEQLAQPMPAGLGVLAHITSLPAESAEQELGTLGAVARSFVDWLADAGVRYWQILPVNPTDDHGSPYAGISAFAGNVRLLEGYPDFSDYPIDAAEYEAFCEREADWLEPYACFMAIREKVGAGIPWQKWAKKYRHFDPAVVERDAKLASSAEACRRSQFVFEKQWKELRAYANERGVQIVGDMPIYVSADSSDAWAHPEVFQLGAKGQPEVVAGCPPDAFAVEGQIWGNPLYDWQALEADGYAWWLRRLERAFDLYDFVRLDHFIGFARYFSIPEGQKATAGVYRPGPGLAFFRAAYDRFGPLPVIAEDLGSITPCVRALVAACGFYGMDIVQFVDGGDPLSGYRPCPEKIAYTGTHDNQTIVGYCATRYPEHDAIEAADELVEMVATCEAPVRVLPLQDVLGLDDDARMNVPGTVEGNWIWQADAAAIGQAGPRLKELVALADEEA